MKKLIFSIALGVSSMVANGQMLVGTNTKLNDITLGVDANNWGYYGSVSYGCIKQGEQAPLFRYDYVAPEQHPQYNNYEVRNISTKETNTKLLVGKVLNNDNAVRVGVHAGLNFNQRETYTNYTKTSVGEFSVLSCRKNINTLVGGLYLNYYVGWVRVDINTQKQVSANFGVFIPFVKSKGCSY